MNVWQMKKDELQKEPCRCETCSACRGEGAYKIDDRSQPEGFDLEFCDYCSGGVSEVCDRCQAMEDLEHQERVLSGI
jgi:DnaJ-class molecular chaperone